MKLFSTLASSLGLAALASANLRMDRHSEIALKVRRAHDAPVAPPEPRGLEKRENGRMTWYVVGLGACGGFNTADQFVVAVNTCQFGGYSVYPPAICGKQLVISYGGKQVQATAVDECPTCACGQLDLSHGLFAQFGNPEQMGEIYADWWFVDGNGPAQPQPSPTTSNPPPPVSTPTTSTTSDAPPPPPSSTSSTSSAAPPPSSSSSSTAAEASETASLGISGGPNDNNNGQPQDPSGPQNLQNMGSVMVQLGNLIAHAGGRQLD